MSDSVGASYEASLFYSEALLRRVVWTFWKRTVGVAFPLMLLLSAFGVLLLAISNVSGWIVGALATFFVLASLVVPAIYVVHYRNTIGRFRRLGRPEATIRANAAALTITSDLVSSTIAWHAIVEIWRYPEFWLLMFSKAQFATLPTATLSPEMQHFIVERVTAAGGKVD